MVSFSLNIYTIFTKYYSLQYINIKDYLIWQKTLNENLKSYLPDECNVSLQNLTASFKLFP